MSSYSSAESGSAQQRGLCFILMHALHLQSIPENQPSPMSDEAADIDDLDADMKDTSESSSGNSDSTADNSTQGIVENVRVKSRAFTLTPGICSVVESTIWIHRSTWSCCKQTDSGGSQPSSMDTFRIASGTRLLALISLGVSIAISANGGAPAMDVWT
jgi:hypothetical protein